MEEDGNLETFDDLAKRRLRVLCAAGVTHGVFANGTSLEVGGIAQSLL